MTMRILFWLTLGVALSQGCANTLLIVTLFRQVTAHEAEGHPRHVRLKKRGGEA
jgi:hypothetical protein